MVDNRWQHWSQPGHWIVSILITEIEWIEERADVWCVMSAGSSALICSDRGLISDCWAVISARSPDLSSLSSLSPPRSGPSDPGGSGRMLSARSTLLADSGQASLCGWMLKTDKMMMKIKTYLYVNLDLTSLPPTPALSTLKSIPSEII